MPEPVNVPKVKLPSAGLRNTVALLATVEAALDRLREVPVSTVTVLLLLSVMPPDQVLCPATLCKKPPPPTVVLEAKVRLLPVMLRLPPSNLPNSSLAPAGTVMLLPGKAESLARRNMPALRVVEVKLLAPAKIRRPAPPLVSVNAPAMALFKLSWAPLPTLTVVFALKVTAPSRLLLPVLAAKVPPSVSASLTAATPRNSKVAPLATVVPVAVVPSPLALLTARMP